VCDLLQLILYDSTEHKKDTSSFLSW